MDTNPASILLDLQQELRGLLLEETVTILNRTFKFRLLTEEETIWTYGFLNPKNAVSIAVAARLANLSIGLREIEGASIEEVFQDPWNALSEGEQASLLAEHKEYQMVYAQLVMDWLRKQPDSFVNQLHGAWQDLEKRREDAQSEIKNSQGEGSEQTEKPNTTEPSQPGELLSTVSE